MISPLIQRPTIVRIASLVNQHLTRRPHPLNVPRAGQRSWAGPVRVHALSLNSNLYFSFISKPYSVPHFEIQPSSNHWSKNREINFARKRLKILIKCHWNQTIWIYRSSTVKMTRQRLFCIQTFFKIQPWLLLRCFQLPKITFEHTFQNI